MIKKEGERRKWTWPILRYYLERPRKAIAELFVTTTGFRSEECKPLGHDVRIVD
jgi:cytochrome c2